MSTDESRPGEEAAPDESPATETGGDSTVPSDPFARLLQLIGVQGDEWISICHDRDGEFTGAPRNVKAAAPSTVAMLRKADPACNVWFGINTLHNRKGMKRGTAKDVARVTSLWIDCDVKAGGFPSFEAAHDFVEAMTGVLQAEPVAIVHTGHGLQPYWRLEDGKDVERATGLVHRFGHLARTVAAPHGLDSVWDLARVFRVPSTWNVKDPTEPVLVRLEEANEDGDILTLDDLEDRLLAYGIGEDYAKPVRSEDKVVDATTWEYAASTCGYVAAMVKGWASDAPDARHPWLVAQMVRLQSAQRYGCVTEDDIDEAAGRLAERFEQLCAEQSPIRSVGAGEVTAAALWARDLVETKTDDEVKTELGAHEHEASATTMESRVFGATERMGLIRQAARARRVSPWAVLGDVLARACSDTEPCVTLPPIIGGKASLNLAVALVSKSGGGKSAAHAVGQELDPCSNAHRIGPGSGEGIIETYLRWVPADAKAKVPGHFENEEPMRALLYADEIEQVGATQDRNGATFGPIIRSMWSGADADTTNTKSGGRRRHLTAHSYRLAIVAGVQEGNADVLLNEREKVGGTPQRWLWFPAEDPAMPDERPEWPKLPSLLGLWHSPGEEPFTVADSVAAVVEGEHVKRNKGEGDALDGHALLTRLKVAALLRIVHEQSHHIDEDTWELAGWIMQVSDGVRARCEFALEAADAARLKSMGRRDVLRTEGQREAVASKAMYYAEKVADFVHEGDHTNAKHAPDAGCTQRCLTQAVRSTTVTPAEAVELAASLGWIEQGEDGRWWPGPSKPAKDDR